MKKLLFLLLLPAVAYANDPNAVNPYKPDAYGHGQHADKYGQPFQWQTQPQQPFIDPNLKVKPDGYGPGVGRDQYGRPVKPKY